MKLDAKREHIDIPVNADLEQDRLEVVALLGDGADDFDELVARVCDARRDLSDALRRACAHYGADLGKRSKINDADLANILGERLRARGKLAQFGDDLGNCRLANEEAERVLRIYAADPALRVMLPLARLRDLFVSTISDFDFAMSQENPGYSREHNWW